MYHQARNQERMQAQPLRHQQQHQAHTQLLQEGEAEGEQAQQVQRQQQQQMGAQAEHRPLQARTRRVFGPVGGAAS